MKLLFKNHLDLIASFIGLIGALLGLYFWYVYKVMWGGSTFTVLSVALYFYIPVCFAIIGSLFHKSHLMFLAFLISLPLDRYAPVNPTYPEHHIPSILYGISAVFMLIKIKRKRTAK